MLLAASLGAQDASKLDRLLDAARNGSPVVRPQAAKRLLSLKEEAAAAVKALVATDDVRFQDLGQDLIEVLGRLEDPQLREQLWTAVDDPDFPWRPAAARSLASSIRDDELSRAAAWMGDPIAPVRAAAVDALGRLDARSHEDRLRALLFTDASDQVRRDVAVLFDAWDERWALAQVVEELDRTDVFFDQDTGRAARFAALKVLESRLGGSLGLRAEVPGSAPDNAEAYAALRDRVKALAGGRWPKIPAIAKVGAEVPPAVLGFEVRSCRAGEFFVRFSADDRLWLGTGGNPTKIALEPGTVAGLLEAAARGLGELEPATWGEPGCDAEQLYLRSDPESPARVWRVSKGADPVVGLRPEALGKVFADLVAATPEDHRGTTVRATLESALAAVGGPLAPGR